MEALLRNHFWIVKALGLAVMTALAASAGSTQVWSSVLLNDEESVEQEDGGEEAGDEDDLDMPDNPFSSTTTRRVTSTTRQLVKLTQDIVSNNVFCPTCVPAAATLVAAAVVDETGLPVGPVIQPGEVKCSLPLRLLATMESSHSQYSFATIRDEQQGTSGLYSPDDLVRPEVLVLSIERGIVHLRNHAALEYLQLGEEPPKVAAAPVPPPEGEDPEKKSDRAIPGAEEAIKCPSEHQCIIERQFVEALMANPAALAKQARIVPNSGEDGQARGFKFYGVRKDSLPKLLGLKNGDVLLSVNGQELSGVDQAMLLYQKLRRASNLSVTIERKGEVINKEFQIQ